jgi:hypothetical protein
MLFSKYQDEEIGGAYSAKEDEKCMQNFGWKA